MRAQDKDTIGALATAPGKGALSLIRLSGKKAFQITRRLCPFLPKNPASHKIYFGTLQNPKTGRAIDEVLVSCFKEGRSFTGEESTEISCHGGSFLASQILSALIIAGCRLAKRGEFSYRAFMQGRMDLIQAESVLHLINSTSSLALEQALKGLKGESSKRLKTLEDKLIKLLAHIEADIDFSSQDITSMSTEKKLKLLEQIKNLNNKELKNFNEENINREGFTVLIMGQANSGKSSLYNHLIGQDKALVTSHPGTTRDILSSRIFLNQREFCIKDTAGFRETSDPIEKKGLKKVLKEIKTAHLILFLLPADKPLNKKSFSGLEYKLKHTPCVPVFSKSDLLKNEKKRKAKEELAVKFLSKNSNLHKKIIWLSSKTGEGVNNLKSNLYKTSEKDFSEVYISSSRHIESLRKMKAFVNKAEKFIKEDHLPECSAFELQQALKALNEMTGKSYNEKVVQQIFKEFCLGK